MLTGRAMGFELQHIPFRSGSNAMQAAATGELDIALATESAARPLVASGKLRVIATTGARRSPFFRDVSTMKEAGYPALVQEEWFAALMPPRTPPTVAQAAADIIADAMRDRDLRETWDTLALTPQALTAAQLEQSIRSEYAFWKKAVADLNFTPEA